MQPKTVKTNLLNFPSSSQIIQEPLGVVLIIAAWNYPLQLLLVPLVGVRVGVSDGEAPGVPVDVIVGV